MGRNRPDVALVTANYGGCDIPWPQAAQDIDVDWVYVTDSYVDTRGTPWEPQETPEPDISPRMAAKLPKFFPPKDYRYAIWINGSYSVTSPGFAQMAIDNLHDGISLFRHPYRDCIYDEAALSATMPIYNGQPIAEQVESYRAEGHPEHWGLWECGAVCWDREHPKVERFCTQWLTENRGWTVQDQLSFPVICRRLGLEPGLFPGTLEVVGGRGGSEWFDIHPHLRS